MLVLAWIYVARLIEFRTDLTGHPGTPAETGLALFVALVLLIGGRLAWFTVQRGLELPVLAIVVMSLLSITTVLGLTISP